ncbi:MAG: hypothetical protein AB9866_14370 [Syntrophobacteraceae bacterium]
MKTKWVLCLSLLFLIISVAPGTGAAARPDGITPGDVAGKPDKFCKVIKEPNPLLLGGWKGVHENFRPKLGAFQKEPVEFYVKKVDGRYAIYFYRFKKESDEKKFRGWREWEIDGDQIRSGTGVRIFVKDGGVYYSWVNDTPTQLTRHEKLEGR